jgi:2-hydroxy-6-oxonona-2,4-dienedioate hydrolase
MSFGGSISHQIGFGLAALAVIAAAVYSFFATDLARAQARVTGRSENIETALGTIEYATAGSGNPVLVIHGTAGGFDQGLDMAGALAGHGYELIAPSRFGYLGSRSRADVSVAAQADAYIQLLNHLGVGKVSIVAISAGAWSALDFASRYPELCQALVLIVPAKQLPPGTQNYGGAIAKAMFDSDFVMWAALKLTPIFPGAMDEIMLGTNASVVQASTPAEKARVQEVLDHLLPMRARSEGMKFDIRTAASPDPVALEKISCPVLAISAEDDLFGTALRARQIAAAVSRHRIVIYPTGGHALMGRQDETLSEVTSFLSQSAAHSP